MLTLLLILSTIVVLTIEAIIVNSNRKIYQDLVQDNSIPDVPTTSVDPDQQNIDDKAYLVALGLRRLKNENVFFVLFSLFQLILGLDAVNITIVNQEFLETKSRIDC